MAASRTDEQAVSAACAIAAEHGVRWEEAKVVHSGSNVVVPLRPAPVVARVMTGMAVLHDGLGRWLSREVSVLRFLEASGLAVRPSSVVSPGPH